MSEKEDKESGYENGEGKTSEPNVTITVTEEAEGEDDELEGDETYTEGDEDYGESDEAGSSTSMPATPDSVTPPTTPSTTPSAAAAPSVPGKKRRRVPRRKKGEIVNLESVRIGFLGTGKIAESIVKGFLNISKFRFQNK